MQVSAKDWARYIGRLQAVNRAAAEVMQGWMDENPGGDVEDMIAVAYAAASHYGDAAAALACEMYDALAEAQGAELPEAEPAETATYSETAKAVRGTIKNQRNSVPDTVGRLVKQAGADTMLQNARRDGAEWAWVPFGGETCAFCITLASRGWQSQSRKARNGDHAEHIHPHCQCEYVVRFDGSSTVEGYDPDRYLEMYENAEGRTPNEKMRSLRRELYAENKDRINGQKRIAYAARREWSLRKTADPLYDIFGPASKSHPDEVARIKQSAREKGVELIEGSGRMAYAPGLRGGTPGQLHLSDNDSIGAWLHEEQHMVDDSKDGWLGFSGLFDVDRRVRMEYNAYMKEITLARKAGRQDIVNALIQNYYEEVSSFGGDPIDIK